MVMAKLEDEGRQTKAVKLTELLAQSKDNNKRGQRQSQGFSQGDYAKGKSFILSLKANKDKCAYCDSTSHIENSC